MTLPAIHGVYIFSTSWHKSALLQKRAANIFGFIHTVAAEQTHLLKDFIFDLLEFGDSNWIFGIASVQIGKNAHPFLVLVRVDEPTA